MTNNITKFIVILLVLVAALLGSLVVLGAMEMETFTDSIARVAGVGLIIIVASALIGFIGSGSKDK